MSKTTEALKLALETAEAIVAANWKTWEELATPEEFERWAKSRANHMVAVIREALADHIADAGKVIADTNALEALREMVSAQHAGPITSEMFTAWKKGKVVIDKAAIREALAEPVKQEPVTREHTTDGSPCWCCPKCSYKDPETGAEVWVHNEPN